MLNINRVIANQQLTVHFQQIISLNRKTVCGLEGLIRGHDYSRDTLIPPAELFSLASQTGKTLELDRVCRHAVLQAFVPIHQQYPEKLLFINIDASILDDVSGSNYLYCQVKALGINPGNIVIEINESKVKDDEALRKFTCKYREHGFLIALDDVGYGFSNIDRILVVKPDIIKIHGSIIQGIDREFGKQSAFASLIELSRSTGSLVIAEGAETQEEVFQVLRLGGQMIQGFYFSRPAENADLASVFANDLITSTNQAFSEHIVCTVKSEQDRNRSFGRVTAKAARELAGVPPEEYDNRLLHVVWSARSIESAYVLDESGIQVSNTINCHDERSADNSLMFYSANAGSDHSMEKYYYPLAWTGLQSHLTEPYVSMATGRLCLTASRAFTGVDAKRYILCLDFATGEPGGGFAPGKRPEHFHAYTSFNGQSTTKIGRLFRHADQEIYLDELTGAYNRRYINERLIIDIIGAANEKQPLSIIMADLDHFKRINDQFGHLAGDRVLVEFVSTIRRCIRSETDWIARYGGEEFLIVLPNADSEIAFRKAEKIRQDFADVRLSAEDAFFGCTASFGTFTMQTERLSGEHLIGQADKNLYQAKRSGRNQTCPMNSLRPSLWPQAPKTVPIQPAQQVSTT